MWRPKIDWGSGALWIWRVSRASIFNDRRNWKFGWASFASIKTWQGFTCYPAMIGKSCSCMIKKYISIRGKVAAGRRSHNHGLHSIHWKFPLSCPSWSSWWKIIMEAGQWIRYPVCIIFVAKSRSFYEDISLRDWKLRICKIQIFFSFWIRIKLLSAFC